MCVGLLLRYAGYTKGEAFGLILDMAGGIGCNVTVFIFPPIVYLKLYSHDSFHIHNNIHNDINDISDISDISEISDGNNGNNNNTNTSSTSTITGTTDDKKMHEISNRMLSLYASVCCMLAFGCLLLVCVPIIFILELTYF